MLFDWRTVLVITCMCDDIQIPVRFINQSLDWLGEWNFNSMYIHICSENNHNIWPYKKNFIVFIPWNIICSDINVCRNKNPFLVWSFASLIYTNFARSVAALTYIEVSQDISLKDGINMRLVRHPESSLLCNSSRNRHLPYLQSCTLLWRSRK